MICVQTVTSGSNACELDEFDDYDDPYESPYDAEDMYDDPYAAGEL